MFCLYSKSSCASCTKAKQLLQDENYEHVIKMLGVDFDILDLYAVAPKSHRTFPMITKLVDGVEEYIGGYEDLIVSIEKGI